MKKAIKIILLYCLITIVVLSCKTKANSLFYDLKEFNLEEAKTFVSKIDKQPKILKISIYDVSYLKNGFSVNGKNIFNDTIQENYPNFYNYKKFAHEQGIDNVELNQILINFDKIKVSEFVREKDFYIFPVEKYALAEQTGYLYNPKNGIKQGDTLFTKTVYKDKVILKKKLQENWFEYESIDL